jgi:hypothetical protein
MLITLFATGQGRRFLRPRNRSGTLEKQTIPQGRTLEREAKVPFQEKKPTRRYSCGGNTNCLPFSNPSASHRSNNRLHRLERALPRAFSFFLFAISSCLLYHRFGCTALIKSRLRTNVGPHLPMQFTHTCLSRTEKRGRLSDKYVPRKKTPLVHHALGFVPILLFRSKRYSGWNLWATCSRMMC